FSNLIYFVLIFIPTIVILHYYKKWNITNIINIKYTNLMRMYFQSFYSGILLSILIEIVLSYLLILFFNSIGFSNINVNLSFYKILDNTSNVNDIQVLNYNAKHNLLYPIIYIFISSFF